MDDSTPKTISERHHYKQLSFGLILKKLKQTAAVVPPIWLLLHSHGNLQVQYHDKSKTNRNLEEKKSKNITQKKQKPNFLNFQACYSNVLNYPILSRGEIQFALSKTVIWRLEASYFKDGCDLWGRGIIGNMKVKGKLAHSLDQQRSTGCNLAHNEITNYPTDLKETNNRSGVVVVVVE